MKKLLFGMSALLVLFSSCGGNDDENSSNNSGVVLLKKTVEIGPEGEFISNATYNGTKLVKIQTNDGERIEFTYTGDNITQMEWFEDGALDQRDTYTYNADGSLATYVRLELLMGWGSKEVYTANANNTVTVTSYSGDLNSQTNLSGTATITFANGEVSQIVDDFGTTVYTYDNKNNPFKNVTGYGKISFIDHGASGINHNIITENYGSGTDEYVYTYNSNDYPATVTETTDDSEYVTTFYYN